MSHTFQIVADMTYIMDKWSHATMLHQNIDCMQYARSSFAAQVSRIEKEFGYNMLVMFISAVADHKENLWGTPGVSY